MSRSAERTGMNLYRAFASPEEIDEQYNLRAQYPDIQATLDHYTALSTEARSALACEPDVRYGPTLDETVDLFPAHAPGAAAVLFIHGGYWRALSSKDVSFAARGLTGRGLAMAAVNYSLCPKVTIAEITRQNRAAVAWLHANAARLNADPDRIFVIGHSAGGHQCAMLLCTDWPGQYGLSADLIKGGIAISGIYDLEPLRHSFLQSIVQLDHDLIRTQSPIHVIPAQAPPLLALAGDGEVAEFQRQPQDFVHAWRAAGHDGTWELRRGADHFNIVDGFAEPQSALCDRVLAFIKHCERNSRPE